MCVPEWPTQGQGEFSGLNCADHDQNDSDHKDQSADADDVARGSVKGLRHLTDVLACHRVAGACVPCGQRAAKQQQPAAEDDGEDAHPQQRHDRPSPWSIMIATLRLP